MLIVFGRVSLSLLLVCLAVFGAGCARGSEYIGPEPDVAFSALPSSCAELEPSTRDVLRRFAGTLPTSDARLHT
ncbi:hypothetical protein Ntsu_17070 [Nocardia sp. IFM 10818]